MRNKFSIFNFQFSISVGFGLIETLIACGIVAMLGAASVGLSNSIIKSNRLGYQKIIATNLASEAIEVAHWIRDKNISDGDNATDWLYSGNSADEGFIKNNYCSNIDCGITPISRDSLGASAQSFMFDKNEDNITIDNVNYTRKIRIYNDITTPNELKITVRVEANNNLLAEVSSIITNWK